VIAAQPVNVAPVKPPLTPEQQKRLEERDRYAQATRRLREQGRLDQAIRACEKMLAIEREVFGSFHEDVVGSLKQLAEIHMELEEFVAAAKVRQELLTICTKLHGDKDWHVADARYSLAEVHDVAQRDAAGRQQFREAKQLNAKVRKLYRERKPVEATEYARKCLALRQKLYPVAKYPDGQPDLANSLNNLGLLLQEQERYAQALPYLEQALAMYQKLYPATKYPNGHPDLALNLRTRGVLLLAQGQYAQALPYLEQALALCQKLYPATKFPYGHLQLAISLTDLGYLLNARGQYAQAQPYYEQALAMYQKLYPATKFRDGSPQLAMSLSNLGVLLQAQGQYAQALPYLEQALAVRQKLYPATKYPNGQSDLVNSLHMLGYLFHLRGQYAQALPYYEQALAMCRKLYPAAKYPDGHSQLALSLSYLGYLLNARGQYAQALPYLEEALATYRKLYPATEFPDGHSQLAMSLNNLGLLLLAQRQYAQALLYLERALAMQQKLYPAAKFPDGHPDLATSLNNMGYLLRAQGQYAQALPYYEQALAMCQKLYPATKYPDGHPLLALSLSNLGFLLNAEGRYAQALPYYEQALALSHRQAQRFAEAATESEALTQARSLFFYRDFLLSITGHLPDMVERTYGLLWSGRDALSRIWQHRHLASLAAASRPDIRNRWADLLDTRRRLARLLQQPLPPEPAARTARDRDVQQLTDQKESLERELARSLPALAAAHPDRSGPAALQTQLPPQTAFLDLFRYVRVEQDPKVPGAEGRLQTPCYVAFVVQASKPIQRVELGEAAVIDRALDSWRRAIAERKESPAADRLRRLVWQPLEKQLAPGTAAVYLAPDGALTRLPWAALPGRRPGTVLMEDYTMGVVEHGPHLLAALRRSKVPADQAGTILAVGGIRYDDAPAPLPPAKTDLLAQRGPDREDHSLRWSYLKGAASELQKVHAVAGSRPVTVLDGTAAGVSRLLRELPQARVVHLATHGFFNESLFREEQRREAEMVKNYAFQMDRDLVLAGQGARSPLSYTGLVLAGANVPDKAGPEGGILTAELLLEVNLEGLELAVLSACQTGLGPVADSQHVQNMAQALHAAGCRDVIASLWRVDDQATAALMERFYQYLWRDNLPPIVALRRAQLDMMRSYSRTKGKLPDRGPGKPEIAGPSDNTAPPGARAQTVPPLYWAGFVLSGTGR
jgi:tetratricopeptide (TPR) repeat protein